MMLKILKVSRGYPTTESRVGVFELDQARALARAGCRVILAALDLRSVIRWRRWGLQRFEEQGVEVYLLSLPVGRLPLPLLLQFYTLTLRYLLGRVFREKGRPDIVHGHFTNIGYALGQVKPKLQAPLVLTEHSSSINRQVIEKSLFKAAGSAYRRADALVAVSPALAARIEEHFQICPVYIPNAYDSEIFTYQARPEDEYFRFVAVGNLLPAKGMALAVKAFQRAFEGSEKVTLTIFGAGPEKEKLERLIGEAGLQQQVFLRGWAGRTEIAAALQVSDCFLLASQAETFGVACIEALAVGLPVIATRCGGPESFLHRENGLLVAVDDLEGFSAAMTRIKKEINSYDRRAIAAEAEKKFSAASVAAALLDLYNRLPGN